MGGSSPYPLGFSRPNPEFPFRSFKSLFSPPKKELYSPKLNQFSHISIPIVVHHLYNILNNNKTIKIQNNILVFYIVLLKFEIVIYFGYVGVKSNTQRLTLIHAQIREVSKRILIHCGVSSDRILKGTQMVVNLRWIWLDLILQELSLWPLRELALNSAGRILSLLVPIGLLVPMVLLIPLVPPRLMTRVSDGMAVAKSGNGNSLIQMWALMIPPVQRIHKAQKGRIISKSESCEKEISLQLIDNIGLANSRHVFESPGEPILTKTSLNKISKKSNSFQAFAGPPGDSGHVCEPVRKSEVKIERMVHTETNNQMEIRIRTHTQKTCPLRQNLKSTSELVSVIPSAPAANADQDAVLKLNLIIITIYSIFTLNCCFKKGPYQAIGGGKTNRKPPGEVDIGKPK